MNYNGKLLVLDNFRTLLKGYSLDIQDIVRSAILDGVDLSDFLDKLKDDPFKLDQIRLCRKENVDPKYFDLSGENIFKVRRLVKDKKDLSGLDYQMTQRNLASFSPEYISTVLAWTEAGYDFDGLNIGIIPLKLLSVFEYGLRNGFDMQPFNNGVNYDAEYVRQCLIIRENGFSLSPFLNLVWDLGCLKHMATFSRIKNQQVWGNALDGLNVDFGSSSGAGQQVLNSVSVHRLDLIIELAKNGVQLDLLKQYSSRSKSFVYSEECLEIVLEAFKKGLDYKVIIGTPSGIAVDPMQMRARMNELDLARSKKIGGRLSKR